MSSLLKAMIPEAFSSDETFQRFLDDHCTHLADGTSRNVYSVNNDEYVVKVATDTSKATCNWTEIAAFYKYTDDQDRLARIESWSHSGKFIVMEKLDTNSEPEQDFDFPVWVTDRKCSNIGKAADGKYKMCDYALVKQPDALYCSEFA